MEILWFVGITVPKVFMMAKDNFNSPNKNTLLNIAFFTLLLPRSDCQFSSLAVTFFLVRDKDSVLDQDDNFDMISLSILITCLLENVYILYGEVAY